MNVSEWHRIKARIYTRILFGLRFLEKVVGIVLKMELDNTFSSFVTKNPRFLVISNCIYRCSFTGTESFIVPEAIKMGGN